MQVMLLPSGKEVASITQHVLTLWRRKETTGEQHVAGQIAQPRYKDSNVC